MFTGLNCPQGCSMSKKDKTCTRVLRPLSSPSGVISTSAWLEALFCATSSQKPSWTIQAAGIAAPGLPPHTPVLSTALFITDPVK